jgi:hypothetical protein
MSGAGTHKRVVPEDFWISILVVTSNVRQPADLLFSARTCLAVVNAKPTDKAPALCRKCLRVTEPPGQQSFFTEFYGCLSLTKFTRVLGYAYIRSRWTGFASMPKWALHTITTPKHLYVDSINSW